MKALPDCGPLAWRDRKPDRRLECTCSTERKRAVGSAAPMLTVTEMSWFPASSAGRIFFRAAGGRRGRTRRSKSAGRDCADPGLPHSGRPDFENPALREVCLRALPRRSCSPRTRKLATSITERSNSRWRMESFADFPGTESRIPLHPRDRLGLLRSRRRVSPPPSARPDRRFRGRRCR